MRRIELVSISPEAKNRDLRKMTRVSFISRKDVFMRGAFLTVLGLSIACLPALGGDDWPQFRGPNGSATATDKSVPGQWSTDKNVAWKAKLPGYGWSSPIVWGDKVFLTTAFSEKQRKPQPGFGGPGEFGGGRPGGGGPGRFGRPQPGQLVPAFMQNFLNLSEEQKKRLEDLQKDTESKLAKLLTDEQKKQLKEARENPQGRGPGGFRPPQVGQILQPSELESVKLSDEQKKDYENLQKTADASLAKIFNDEQKKQIKTMREGFGRGGFGGMQKPPDAMYKLEVCCLDRATGEVLWNKTAYEGKPRIPTQSSNTYATETPLTDGERVYAYFGMHGVYCYDLKGKQLWKKDLGSYPMAMGYGTGSSPALAEGKLFVQCDNEEKSFLVALDASTGEEKWRVQRKEKTGFSTPLVWKNKVRTEIVCLGSPTVRSYDPATGNQLWELGGMAGQAKASPVADAEMLYVGTGGGPGGMFGGRGGPGRGGPPGGGMAGNGNRPLFAVKAGASGDITLKKGENSNKGVAWYQAKAGPQTASPLLYEGYLYILDEHGGFISCYDAKTGEQTYKERLTGARGFTSSPWAVDGKVYCLDDAGTTFVLKAGSAFKMLGKNTIEEMAWSSPAVASHALFLRTVDHLYCIQEKK
jgi:outer membrane protein assembly factor BamB